MMMWFKVERWNSFEKCGTTEDVANACLFLASDMSYISGQVLNVCGGMLT
jgi:NAD(P)-dependent dehydrogenase (short-subunit alcohol dehydrogenase family)